MKNLCTLLLLPCLLLLAACRPGASGPAENNRTPLSASIGPLAWLVEQVAGPDYEVITLVPPGSNAETYEPTPGQMVSLSESRLYFSVGTLPFETQLANRLAEAAPDVRTIRLFDGLQPLPASHGHGHYDPHVWMSPHNVSLMARRICAELCRTDTAAAPGFRRRLSRLEARLDSLDTALRRRLAPVGARTFFINHPALGYFAQAYGLRQIALEPDGKEPSAAHLAALTNTARLMARRGQAQLMFGQRGVPLRTARYVAAQAGLRLVVVDPLSADWMYQMDCISKAFAP